MKGMLGAKHRKVNLVKQDHLKDHLDRKLEKILHKEIDTVSIKQKSKYNSIFSFLFYKNSMKHKKDRFTIKSIFFMLFKSKNTIVQIHPIILFRANFKAFNAI